MVHYVVPAVAVGNYDKPWKACFGPAEPMDLNQVKVPPLHCSATPAVNSLHGGLACEPKAVWPVVLQVRNGKKLPCYYRRNEWGRYDYWWVQQSPAPPLRLPVCIFLALLGSAGSQPIAR